MKHFILLRVLALSLAGVLMSGAAKAQPLFDPAPWLKDLDIVEKAFATRYANLDWFVFVREVNPKTAFAEARKRIERASSPVEAQAAFRRLADKIGDGHVEFEWRTPSISAARSRDTCAELGYDARYNGRAVVLPMAGYRALPDDIDANLPAGLISAGGTTVGVLRIGTFGPQASPGICTRALRELKIPAAGPCDENCAAKVEKRAYVILTRNLEERLRALRRKGATALLLDLTGNGGGSEWAEAVARILTAKPLRSALLGFVRTPEWAEKWASLSRDLRSAAKKDGESRDQLLSWADQADAASVEANKICPSDAYWSGQRPSCTWLGNSGYATGLLADASLAAINGKSWASLVYSPAQYDFTPGIWSGPVVVAVDGDTWSAAEEVAALLQDNRAAVILGMPTGGAGCGHASGAAPTELPHTKGQLKLPDCARFRRDGSNEVAGIMPDIFTGSRYADGPKLKAQKLAAALPQALAKAAALR